MEWRELKPKGAFEFSPRIFADERGFFTSPITQSALHEATGHPAFPVAQVSHSRSSRGTLRGIHFTATPPGMAKYVFCTRGKILDYVVDLRVGSPSFGAWETIDLDPEKCRSLYLPVGFGHAFATLEDDTSVTYLLSQEYVAENELAISLFDPDLDLPLPGWPSPLLSPRDRAAPSLTQAQEQGILPYFKESQKLDIHLYPHDEENPRK